MIVSSLAYTFNILAVAKILIRTFLVIQMFREQFREHHKDSKMLEVVSTQKILWNFSKPSSQEEGQLEVPISILTAF